MLQLKKTTSIWFTLEWNGKLSRSTIQLSVDIPSKLQLLAKGDTIITSGRSAIFPKGDSNWNQFEDYKLDAAEDYLRNKRCFI